MWSAGICLFVMLIGTVPFKATSMDNLRPEIRNGQYDFGEEVLSNAAQDILKRLICINPRKRLTAKQCL